MPARGWVSKRARKQPSRTVSSSAAGGTEGGAGHALAFGLRLNERLNGRGLRIGCPNGGDRVYQGQAAIEPRARRNLAWQSPTPTWLRPSRSISSSR